MAAQESVQRAVPHYRILFTFPRRATIVAALLLVSIAGGLFSYTIAFTVKSGVQGVVFSITSWFLPSLIGEVIVTGYLIRDHPILDLRRVSAISLVTTAVWATALILAAVGERFLHIPLLARGFTFGFPLVISLRVLAFFSLTEEGVARKSIASLITPSLSLIVGAVWFSLTPRLFSVALVSAAIMGLYAASSLYVLDSFGVGFGYGRLTPLFRAFIHVWMEDEPSLLEGVLDEGGVEIEAPVRMLGFGTRGQLKALLVAPDIHYGPFRSVGSSSLPSLMQERLGAEFNCPIFPLHTIVGHETDLTSRTQSEGVLDRAIWMGQTMRESDGASPLVRSTSGAAKATCQIFGSCALITLTLAPRTTEDLPSRIRPSISERAKSWGMDAIVVDAHNCLQDYEMEIEDEGAEELEGAAIDALKRARRSARQTVMVGASHIPARFGVENGMGEAGINVLVVKLKQQTVSYVVIDGNNMIPGLRERIMEAASGLGVGECEVLTTDTHVVNAIGTSKRGYPLVGERVPETEIIADVRAGIQAALNDMSSVNTLWAADSVRVKVVGERLLQRLCDAVDRGISYWKRLMLSIYALPGVLCFILTFFL
ncbi:MAG: DUF2070 family protein [Candidatus Bathyarchaeia archaeon]